MDHTGNVVLSSSTLNLSTLLVYTLVCCIQGFGQLAFRTVHSLSVVRQHLGVSGFAAFRLLQEALEPCGHPAASDSFVWSPSHGRPRSSRGCHLQARRRAGAKPFSSRRVLRCPVRPTPAQPAVLRQHRTATAPLPRGAGEGLLSFRRKRRRCSPRLARRRIRRGAATVSSFVR